MENDFSPPKIWVLSDVGIGRMVDGDTDGWIQISRTLMFALCTEE